MCICQSRQNPDARTATEEDRERGRHQPSPLGPSSLLAQKSHWRTHGGSSTDTVHALPCCRPTQAVLTQGRLMTADGNVQPKRGSGHCPRHRRTDSQRQVGGHTDRPAGWVSGCTLHCACIRAGQSTCALMGPGPPARPAGPVGLCSGPSVRWQRKRDHRAQALGLGRDARHEESPDAVGEMGRHGAVCTRMPTLGGVSGRDTSHLKGLRQGQECPPAAWTATAASPASGPGGTTHPDSLGSSTESCVTLGELHQLPGPQFIC